MEEQEVNLRDYIRVIKKQKKVILLVFSIVVIASVVISFLLPPVYQARLTIKIGEIIDMNTFKKEPIETVIAASQFLKGPQILEKTIKDLKLPYSLKEFREKVFVEPVRATQDLVEIKVETNNSSEAVNIANYLANKLLERHKEIKKIYENKEMILARYDEQIRQISKELDEINKNKEGILARYEENIKQISNQLVLMKKEIDKAKKEMAKLEVSLEAASKEMEKKMRGSEPLSDAEASILIGRFYDMRSRWENYRSNIAGRQQQYDNLLAKLREIQLEKTEFQKTKQVRYDTLMSDLRQAQMEKARLQRAGSIKMYSTEILVPAEKSKYPIRPNRPLNILVAAVVGLIVGLGLAFSLEYFEKPE